MPRTADHLIGHRLMLSCHSSTPWWLIWSDSIWVVLLPPPIVGLLYRPVARTRTMMTTTGAFNEQRNLLFRLPGAAHRTRLIPHGRSDGSPAATMLLLLLGRLASGGTRSVGWRRRIVTTMRRMIIRTLIAARGWKVAGRSGLMAGRIFIMRNRWRLGDIPISGICRVGFVHIINALIAAV